MCDEKTLILFKPDCVRKNLSGVILQRLLAEGFRLRGMKMMQLDDAILREHYGHIIDLVIDGEPLFPKLSAFMQTSPVVALVLSGPGVITRVRTILGPTNSMKADKGTIRGDWGTNSMLNICHASDSPESAEVEVKRFFKPEERVTRSTVRYSAVPRARTDSNRPWLMLPTIYSGPAVSDPLQPSGLIGPVVLKLYSNQ